MTVEKTNEIKRFQIHRSHFQLYKIALLIGENFVGFNVRLS